MLTEDIKILDQKHFVTDGSTGNVNIMLTLIPVVLSNSMETFGTVQEETASQCTITIKKI